MPNKIYYQSPKSFFPPVHLEIIFDDQKILTIDWNKKKKPTLKNLPLHVKELIIWLDQYFNGKNPKAYPLKNLQLNQLTSFQQEVLKELYKISYGKTKSYSDIAEKINRPKAVRAVGGACHINPYSLIIPCHRVVGKNNSLTGYRGGIEIKQNLLALENKS